MIFRFQFGLRTLLIAAGGCCVLLAFVTRFGFVSTATLVWFLLLVTAHVVGNAWGTRSTRWPRWVDPAESSETSARETLAPDWTHLPPATLLRLKACLSPTLRYATLTGAAVGATAGVLSLKLGILGESGIWGVLVGGVSSAIVAGFLVFLCASWTEVASMALREALRPAERSLSAAENFAPQEKSE